MKESKISLGGFPPIYYITTETKKKREFNKQATADVDTTAYKNLNILKTPTIKLKQMLNKSSDTE